MGRKLFIHNWLGLVYAKKNKNVASQKKTHTQIKNSINRKLCS